MAITSSPLLASIISYPCWRSCSATTSRMPGSSSHTRISPSPRSPGPAISEGKAVSEARADRDSCIHRVVPGPDWLGWAQIAPPCCWMMLRQIARPRPVPPFLLASPDSTCWKRSKTASSLSAGMPRPRSTTFSATELVSESIWTETFESSGENLIAFESRFVSTCRMRSGSASK